MTSLTEVRQRMQAAQSALAERNEQYQQLLVRMQEYNRNIVLGEEQTQTVVNLQQQIQI